VAPLIDNARVIIYDSSQCNLYFIVMATVITFVNYVSTVITIINYDRTVITIVNYDPKTLIVQATGAVFTTLTS
jgi:hypothetical protein